MDIDRRPFGTRADGRPVERFDFSAGSVAVTVLDHGATLASIMVPDANGDVADITLGFDTIDGWTSDRQFFGSTVGRYANRIANARFPLGEQVIELVPNDGPHQLHGGPGVNVPEVLEKLRATSFYADEALIDLIFGPWLQR